MATPIEQATRRCASRVEFSATTAKTTSPGLRYFSPSLRVIILHWGGKIDETRTRFCAAIPASRKAISKDVRRSLCLPTPLVKKRRFGTMFLPNSKTLRICKPCNECASAPTVNPHWRHDKNYHILGWLERQYHREFTLFWGGDADVGGGEGSRREYGYRNIWSFCYF